MIYHMFESPPRLSHDWRISDEGTESSWIQEEEDCVALDSAGHEAKGDVKQFLLFFFLVGKRWGGLEE